MESFCLVRMRRPPVSILEGSQPTMQRSSQPISKYCNLNGEVNGALTPLSPLCGGQASKTLQTLDLSANEIRAEGAKAVAVSLKVCNFEMVEVNGSFFVMVE